MIRRTLVGLAATLALIAILVVPQPTSTKAGALPLWIGVFGLIAALSTLSTSIEVLGMDASSLAFFGTTVVQLWFLAVGLWLLLRGRKQVISK